MNTDDRKNKHFSFRAINKNTGEWFYWTIDDIFNGAWRSMTDHEVDIDLDTIEDISGGIHGQPIEPKERKIRLMKIHQDLHHSLDKLVACYISNTKKNLTDTSVMKLIEWSHKQTSNPTCHKE